MLIPRHWSRATGSADDPDGKRFALKIWGWSLTSDAEAAALARRRLTDASARVASGAVGRDEYLYGKTPLREQIVRTLDGTSGDPAAIVTRNRYGALVLNAARTPFVDVDVSEAPPPRGGLMSAIFGKKPDPKDAALQAVRAACARFPAVSFRVYRTFAGFRLMATDSLMDPKSRETEAMLSAFGADPFFTKLCNLQASFRARLTPKPWRVGCRLPPASYPFDSLEVERRYSEWLREYEAAIQGKATCAFLESIGPGKTLPESAAVVAEHDRACRVGEDLPLA
jgi:hypothetical protein